MNLLHGIVVGAVHGIQNGDMVSDVWHNGFQTKWLFLTFQKSIYSFNPFGEIKFHSV